MKRRAVPSRRAALAGMLAGAAFVAALAVLASTSTLFRIHGASMKPALAQDEVVLTSVLPLWTGGPSRWDVLIFRRAHGHEANGTDAGDAPDLTLVKRVAGLPHETVLLAQEGLRVDGRIVEAPVPAEWTRTGRYALDPPGLALAPGEYFMLGDNGRLSRDSRSWGPVHRESLRGKVLFVVWPPARWRRVE